MNAATILDLITARQAAATAARDHLRRQMATLAGGLAAIERELSDLWDSKILSAVLTSSFTRPVRTR